MGCVGKSENSVLCLWHLAFGRCCFWGVEVLGSMWAWRHLWYLIGLKLELHEDVELRRTASPLLAVALIWAVVYMGSIVGYGVYSGASGPWKLPYADLLVALDLNYRLQVRLTNPGSCVPAATSPNPKP